MIEDLFKQLNSLSNKMQEQIESDEEISGIFGELDKDQTIKELRKNATDNYAELQLIIKKFVTNN